jgi:hypothetical protein
MTISKTTVATVGLSIGVFFSVVGMSPYIFVPEHTYPEVGPENQALINAYIEPVRVAKKAVLVEDPHDSELAIVAAAGHWCDLHDQGVLKSMLAVHAEDTSSRGPKQEILRARDSLILRLMKAAQETDGQDTARSAALARLALRLTHIMKDGDLNSLTLSLSHELRIREYLAGLGASAPPITIPERKLVGLLFSNQASLEGRTPGEVPAVSVASAIVHSSPSTSIDSPEWKLLETKIGNGQPSRMLVRHVLYRIQELSEFDLQQRLVKK